MDAKIKSDIENKQNEKKGKDKTLTMFFKDMQNAMHYRWEFLRKNTEYQKQCDSWKRLNKKKKNCDLAQRFYEKVAAEYDFPPMNYKKDLWSNYEEQCVAFAETNGLTRPSRNDKRSFREKYPYYDERTEIFISSRGLNSVLRVRGYSEDMLLCHAPSQALKKISFPARKKEIEARTLRVDLNLMYPKDLILKMLSKLIEDCSLERGGEEVVCHMDDGTTETMKLPKAWGIFGDFCAKASARFRPEDYEVYLEYFSLRESGATVDEIAKQKFRSLYNNKDQKNYAKQKVRRILEAVDEHITGKKYLEIR